VGVRPSGFLHVFFSANKLSLTDDNWARLSVKDCIFYATADEADVYMFYRCFFVFSARHKNTRQPFSGTAERIFMKLLPNDSRENGVCIAVPKWGARPPN